MKKAKAEKRTSDMERSKKRFIYIGVACRIFAAGARGVHCIVASNGDDPTSSFPMYKQTL